MPRPGPCAGPVGDMAVGQDPSVLAHSHVEGLPAYRLNPLAPLNA